MVLPELIAPVLVSEGIGKLATNVGFVALCLSAQVQVGITSEILKTLTRRGKMPGVEITRVILTPT